MTTRRIGGIVAAVFALGILTGAAGTIIIRDANPPDTGFAAVMADHMGDLGMGSMMSGAMMGSGSMMGSGAMMGSGSMMGPGSFSGPGMMGGPAASSMPGSLHDQHHPAASPDGSK